MYHDGSDYSAGFSQEPVQISAHVTILGAVNMTEAAKSYMGTFWLQEAPVHNPAILSIVQKSLPIEVEEIPT